MSSEQFNLDDDDSPEPISEEKKLKDRQDLYGQYTLLPMALMLDLQDDKLTKRDVIVYCYLLAKKDDKQEYWAGLKRISSLTGIPETGLKESIAKLIACGHLKVYRRMGTTSMKRCLMYVAGDYIFIKGKQAVHVPRKKDAEQTNEANASASSIQATTFGHASPRFRL